MINKKIFLAGIFLILVLTFVCADYSISTPQLTKPGLNSANYNYGTSVSLAKGTDAGQCEKGQDFLLQVAPFGCTPAVVRSDLLEEQNVPVFCQLAATQINPLIDVNAISHITFKGNLPDEVTGVGFHPAQAAIDTSGSTLLNSPILENVGYAVIVLKKQNNESSMPDSVSGTLTATIKYDIKNTFGVGKATFYLPESTNEEWETKYSQYGFWRDKGYVKADSLDTNSATISIYSGDGKTKIATTTISKGDTSSQINLPGFYCLAGLQIRLDSLENPNTRARLNINGEIVEVAKGEQFLENKCTIVDVRKSGLTQKVSIKCKSDERTETFDLRINPRVKLEINGVTKDYSVGDYLYVSADNSKAVYLGYVGTKKGTDNLDDTYILLFAKPVHTSLLSESELSEVDSFDRLTRSSDFGAGIIDVPADLGRFVLSGVQQMIKYLKDGKSYAKFSYDKFSVGENFQDSKVKIIGFAEPADRVLDGDSLKNYNFAMSDYRTIIDSFPNAQEILSNKTEEKILSEKTFGEQAFFEAIQLAKSTEQKKTMLSLCKEFKEKFPKSETIIPECDSPYKNSNQELSTENVLINSVVKSISFDGVYEPSLDEFSAVVRVRNASGSSVQYTLQKDTPIYLTNNTNEFIELKNLEQDYATVRVHILPKGALATAENFLTTDSQKLNKNEGIGVGGFVFTVTDIKLKKFAKVSVLPKVENTGTEANFSFNIGIEKRAIQLAPDEIEDRIDDLENLIEDWSKISNDLGDAVKTLNTACLSTGVLLTAKNFFDNAGGKSIARNKVMKSEGGWTDICKTKVSKGEFSSLDDCFLENSDKIDADVENYYSAIEKIKISGENKDQETKSLANSLDATITNPQNPKEFIDTKNIVAAFNYEGENNSLQLSQVRDLKAIETALENNPSEELKTLLNIQKYKLLSDINVNVESQVVSQSFIERLNAKGGLNKVTVRQYGDKDTIQGVYDGGTTTSTGFGEIVANAKIQAIVYRNTQYLLELTETSAKEYNIVNVYDADGNKLLATATQTELDKTHRYDANVAVIKQRFSGFKLFDKSTYQNKFKDAEVKYFETAPYKGMAAQVPFDLENGWYAAMKQTLATGGSAQTYDASGAVSSFYLCNVGENGKAEFNSGIRDDICQGYNPGTGQIVGEFSGLTPSQTNVLVTKAISAINSANSQYSSGVTQVKIGTATIKVGNPEIGVPEMQCQDFMSPKDCHLLFNVCDPVVCPSSRCNLGGTYYSSDVIQSGIIGSIALCLPNFKENIFIPICLTGLKAGIDNLLSVFTSYRDCLQTQLDSGETVGICDELHSIYLCEFFWREALPFADTIIPRIFESLLGQDEGTRGGGEYLGVQSAWDNAQNSVDFMSNYYGRDITNAFKVKVTEEVGGAVCKNFISANYPSSGEVLDSLVEPDSPPQYTAYFEEIPFTTATVPATSQYKVFYHIYAGANSKAYYQVYLKTPSGTSLYQTSPSITVASGFINRGSYASETKDFTAVTGYKELCISINGEENCGFGKVSTSFAVDYLEDLYLQEQAKQTDIKSEADCISGTSSLYSLAQPNLQEGASDIVSPSLYDSGITRVCSTDSPGKGTDVNWNNKDAKWQNVGTCDGEVGELKCWLDRQSVKDSIKTTSIENETLGDVANNYLSKLIKEGNYLDFSKTITEINNLDSDGKTGYITDTLIERALFSYQKSKLYLIRGNAYSEIAVKFYGAIKKTATTASTTQVDAQKLNANLNTIFQNCRGQYPGQCDVAKRVVELAREIKLDKKIDDAAIKSDTGADCFEQFILMQAMQESGVSHCKNKEQWNGKDFANDLTCDGDENFVLGSSDGLSSGIMQINTKVHTNVDAKNFDANVRYGINYLIQNYNVESKVYDCKSTTYSGWKRALRFYNGWNTDCKKGDVNYVENVLTQKYVVGSFGNVCDTISGTSATKIEYPIFEYADGSISFNLFFTFIGTGWVWDTSASDVRNGNAQIVEGYTSSAFVSSESEKLISILHEKNYEQGLQLLIDKIIAEGVPADLLTTNVIFSPDKVFAIAQSDGSRIYLQNDGTTWRYSTDRLTWNTDLLNSKNEVVKAVNGKTLVDGAKIIFDIDKEETQYGKIASTIASSSLTQLDLSSFDSVEREIILRATDCSNCGDNSEVEGIKYTNICGEEECLAIGKKLGVVCEYNVLGLDRCKKAEIVATPQSCADCGTGTFNPCDETECLAINQILDGNKCEWKISTFPFYNCFEIPEKYNFQTALDKINNEKLSGSYYENKEFFDRLLSDGVLTFDEHNQITLIYDEKDIDELKILLQEKIGETIIPEGTYVETNVWTLETAIDKVNELVKKYGNAKYSDNEEVKIFIDELCPPIRDSLLSEEDCDEIDGTLFGFTEEDLDYVRVLLREKQLEENIPITIEK